MDSEGDEEDKMEDAPELMMKKVRSKVKKARKHKIMPYVDKVMKA